MDQNSQQNNNDSQVQGKQAQAQQSQQVLEEPQSPVGSLKKEQTEPIGQTEWVTPSEKEPFLHSEVKEAGVEAVSQTPQFTTEQIKVGIEHAKESTPVSTVPMAVSLLKEIEAKDGQKKDASNSISWFWILLSKITKQLNGKPS